LLIFSSPRIVKSGEGFAFMNFVGAQRRSLKPQAEIEKIITLSKKSPFANMHKKITSFRCPNFLARKLGYTPLALWIFFGVFSAFGVVDIQTYNARVADVVKKPMAVCLHGQFKHAQINYLFARSEKFRLSVRNLKSFVCLILLFRKVADELFRFHFWMHFR
jgi:hypothetical protein